MIAEGQLQREARRMLRALSASGMVLMRLNDGGFAAARRAGAAETSRIRVAAEIAAAMRVRDWIAPLGTVPESFVISDAGAGWLARLQADGDPYAAQHQIRKSRLVIDAAGVERAVTVNEGESVLGWLRTRRLIDKTQEEAGERLRRDFTLAQLSPRLGVDLTAPIVLGRRGVKFDASLSQTVIDAKKRFARAMNFAGPGLADLLFDVCCHMIGLEDAERTNRWPSRSAKIVLQIALDRLAVHYGLKVIAPARARMRSWQME